MQADNVTAENSKESQKNTGFDTRGTIRETKKRTMNTNEDEIADVLSFFSIFCVLYLPLALVLTILTLSSLLIPFAIAISFAIFYSKN